MTTKMMTVMTRLSAMGFCWFLFAPLVLGVAVTPEVEAVVKQNLDFDVLVYGATPAGIQAAVAAGRELATSGSPTAASRVVLVEPGQYLGGMMSGGLGVTDTGVHPETIGGAALEFFERVGQYYGDVPARPAPFCIGKELPWKFEPHVAEAVFRDMLREAHVTVLTSTEIISLSEASGLREQGRRIESAVLSTGRAVGAQFWIDGTYEGSLLRLFNVSHTWGRESREAYNESVAGVLPEPVSGPPYGNTHQFSVVVNPFTDATNTSCLPHMTTCDAGGGVGVGDDRIGAYDWRVVLSYDPNNMTPIPEPESYDPSEFELLRRTLRAHKAQGQPFKGLYPPHPNIPGNKTDWKVHGPDGFTGEYVGGSWAYPTATRAGQIAIVAEHKRFILALLKFWRTDPEVPMNAREAWQQGKVGLPLDEFNRSAHWSPQLYVREALRLQGEYVMTQHDIQSATSKPDSIGIGSYTIDVPGNVQRIVRTTSNVTGRHALLEGGLQTPEWCDTSQPPYALPFRSLVPLKGDCTNLLVPTALSATHVAFSAIRMEPQWMILGQSAGVAAAIAALEGDDKAAIQDINVTQLQVRLRELGQMIDLPSSDSGTKVAFKN